MGSAFNLTCQNASYLFKPSKFNKYKSTKNIGFRYIIKVKAIYRQILFFLSFLFCFVFSLYAKIVAQRYSLKKLF